MRGTVMGTSTIYLPGEDFSRYIADRVTRKGLKVHIRPVMPGDGPFLENGFKCLSAQSIYYRFLGHLRSLTPAMIAQLTGADYRWSMSLLATDMAGERELFLGLGQYSSQRGRATAETALVVCDAWQRMGIGSVLLEHLEDIARERGLQSLRGIVLDDNEPIKALAVKLGFVVSKRFDRGQIEMMKTLN